MLTREPYRYFFPLGVFGGIWGALLWILFSGGWLHDYPGVSHPNMMIGGFLLSYITGFLMTAIPRFTGTSPATPIEISFGLMSLLIFFTLEIVSVWIPQLNTAGLITQCVTLGLLIRFAVSRFLVKTSTPPPSFVFLGFALLFGATGSLLLVVSSLDLIPSPVTYLGRALFYQGMVLSLILGVGSRLVPAFLGTGPNPLASAGKEQLCASIKKYLWPTLGGLFLCSFIIEFLINAAVGRLLRAAVTTFIVFNVWKIHLPPPRKGHLPFWIRISGLFLCMGLWMYGVSDFWAVHALHLTFVSGFSLLTLLVATRVTLAHGGETLEFELKSKSLSWIGFLIVSAALSRALAPVAEKTYLPHLAFAAALWIIAITIWAWIFIPKLKK